MLDALEAERLAIDAFDRALGDFLGDGADPERLDFVAAYQPDALRAMVRTAHEWKRSRGEREPELRRAAGAAAGRRARGAGRGRGRCAGRSRRGADPGKQVLDAMKRLEECGELVETGPYLPAGKVVEKLKLGGNAKALRSGPVRATTRTLAPPSSTGACGATTGRRTRCSSRAAAPLRRPLRGRQARPLGPRLRGPPALRPRPPARPRRPARPLRRALHARDGRRVPGHEPAAERAAQLLERDNLFRVGDENQSIYGFRHADVDVFRDHHRDADEAGRADVRVGQLPQPRRGPRRHRPRLRADLAARSSSRSSSARTARAQPPVADPPVELLAVDRSAERWKARFDGQETPFGETLRSAPLWRACEARLLARRVSELIDAGYDARRRGPAAAGHHAHGLLRASPRGARHPDPSRRRPRLLGPAAGARPAPLARRARQPDGRAGDLLGARLAARRCLPRRAVARAHPRAAAAGATSGGRSPRPSAATAARGSPRLSRKATAGSSSAACGSSARSATLAPRMSLETADRPRGHAHGLRPSRPFDAGGRPADGERPQADAARPRVRGRRGPRPARLHRLRGRA